MRKTVKVVSGGMLETSTVTVSKRLTSGLPWTIVTTPLAFGNSAFTPEGNSGNCTIDVDGWEGRTRAVEARVWDAISCARVKACEERRRSARTTVGRAPLPIPPTATTAATVATASTSVTAKALRPDIARRVRTCRRDGVDPMTAPSRSPPTPHIIGRRDVPRNGRDVQGGGAACWLKAQARRSRCQRGDPHSTSLLF